MKKSTGLFVAGLLSSALLAYLYANSESQLAKRHQSSLELLRQVRQADVTLDRDILRARTLLDLSYDSLAEGADKLRASCDRLSEPQGLTGIDPELDGAVRSLCTAVEAKLNQIEVFKSRNAVFRNSVYLLHSLAEVPSVAGKNLSESVHDAQHELIGSALAYAIVSSAEGRQALGRNLTFFAHLKGADLAIVRSHARNVFESKPELDNSLQQVLAGKTDEAFGLVVKHYFNLFERQEARARFFHALLLTAALGFLALVVVGARRLRRVAEQLREANDSLEEKVVERTRELRRSQEMILKQQQALAVSAKLSALGEMAAGIAHEINNPVTIIQLNAAQIQELSSEEPIDKARIAKMAVTIEDTSERIGKIVHGLRVFCWNGATEQLHPVSVRSLINDTVGLCRERFRNSGIPIQLDLPAEELHTPGHPTQLSQVLLNLLNNAHDAVADLPEKWVRVTVEHSAAGITIRVEDSGKGIPAEQVEKLFQPFFTTKAIGKGTGLGLSISQGIVRRHQGELYVDRERPHTCFTLRLPGLDKTAAA